MESKLEDCKYGKNCYLTSMDHFNKYKHDPKQIETIMVANKQDEQLQMAEKEAQNQANEISKKLETIRRDRKRIRLELETYKTEQKERIRKSKRQKHDTSYKQFMKRLVFTNTMWIKITDEGENQKETCASCEDKEIRPPFWKFHAKTSGNENGYISDGESICVLCTSCYESQIGNPQLKLTLEAFRTYFWCPKWTRRSNTVKEEEQPVYHWEWREHNAKKTDHQGND